VHTNTIEGVWTTVRNFLRPFRGVHKKYLKYYLAMCEHRINRKRITPAFICGKKPDREVGDGELPESSWLGMVGG
jgi:hypothetical protein